MRVAEIAKLPEGRQITVHVTEEEHTAVFSAGINFLVAQGLLALDGLDNDERIASDEVNEELDASTQDSVKEIKH